MSRCLLGCVVLCLLGGCGLTQAQLDEMNREISGRVATLRGWELKKPVACRVTDLDHMTDKIRRELKREYPGDKLALKEASLKMLGVLPSEADIEKDLIRFVRLGVAGFYLPSEKTLYVRKDFPNFLRRIILAHELVHAVDDQYLDLEKLMDRAGDDEDAGFAVSAIVEGSARELESKFTKNELERIGFLGAVGVVVELMPMLVNELVNPWSQSNQLAATPRYYLTMLARYSQGARFLEQARKARGKPTHQWLIELTKDLPASSEQILHPDKYWNPKGRENPVPIDHDAVVKALGQAGLKVVAQDTMGELLCGLVTTAGHHGLTTQQMLEDQTPSDARAWTGRASEGWGNDRFYLIEPEKEGGACRGLWITTWDRPRDRDEFHEAYATHRPETVSSADSIALSPLTRVYGFNLDPAKQAVLLEKLKPLLP